jgi:peptidoglycan-N-acetylglucosamine deacetylase
MPIRTWCIVTALKVVSVALWFAGWQGAALIVFFGTDVFLLHGVFVPSAQGICPVFTRFETDRSEIWLTIDDGPDPADTPRILDLLDGHGARATFFLIGERAANQPAIVAEIVRRGHEVAHHTHTHPARTFWCAGPARVRRELDAALAAMRPAGTPPRWFRPPVGIKNFFLGGELAKRGLRCVGWSVRSYDSIMRDPAKVAGRVMAKIRPGAIVVMHEGEWLDRNVRVRALELVLEALAARDVRCVLPPPAQLR